MRLRGRIARAAGGNPLFISEMLAMAVGKTEVEVPPTLRALLATRLDQLDTSERTILERGAVEGEIFHRGAVQALTPEEAHVTTRLAGLVRRELIRPDRAQLVGDDGYRFRHLLIRDAAYDALPKAVRADLHARFADWLDEHGHSLVERDEIVAYHLEQAARYLVELGRPASESVPSAQPNGWRRQGGGLTGESTRKRRFHSSSARQRIAEPSARLLIDLGMSCEDTPVKSLPLLERAEAQAEAAGDAPSAALARALAARMRLGMLECSADEQEQVALAALPVLEAAGDNLGLCAVWISLADGVYNFRGHYAQAEHAAEEAVRHSRLAGWRTYPYFLPVALHHGPHPAEDALRRLRELGADYPHPGIDMRQAVLLAMLGRIDEARALAAHERRAVPRKRGGKPHPEPARGDRRARRELTPPRTSCFASSARTPPSMAKQRCFLHLPHCEDACSASSAGTTRRRNSQRKDETSVASMTLATGGLAADRRIGLLTPRRTRRSGAPCPRGGHVHRDDRHDRPHRQRVLRPRPRSRSRGPPRRGRRRIRRRARTL